MVHFSTEDNQLIDDLNEFILKLIKDAGNLVIEGFYNITKQVTRGNMKDAVTEYDIHTENFLINGIRTLFPDHKFIAEESNKSQQLTDDPTWIIDPIDGTINFIHGNPFVCISVAFLLKREIVIGIIYNPVMNELYTSRKGHGSQLNGKSIRCSNVEELNDSIFAFDIHFLLSPIEEIRKKFLKQIYRFSSVAAGTRSIGSAALCLAYIARGAIDGYIVQYLKPWDIAAGALLIREAGGCFCSIDGSTFDLMKGEMISAGTEKLRDKLVDGIKECEKWEIIIKK